MMRIFNCSAYMLFQNIQLHIRTENTEKWRHAFKIVAVFGVLLEIIVLGYL